MSITEEQFQDILEQSISSLHSGSASVDEILARYPEMPTDQKEELATALWLADTDQLFDPRPEFVRDSRKNLLIHIHREANTYNRTTIRINRILAGLASFFSVRHSLRYALVVVIFLIFIASSTGVALVSQDSLPGETLYPIKLRIEDARLSLSLSAAQDANLRKEYASERLTEIQSLIKERKYDHLSAVADNYNFQFTQLVGLLEQISKQNPDKAQKLAENYRSELITAAQPLHTLAQSVPIDQRSKVTGILNRIENRLPAIMGGAGSNTPGDKSPLVTQGGPPGLSGTKEPGAGGPGKRTQAPPFAQTRTPEPTLPSSTSNGEVQSKTPTPTPSSTASATHKPKPTRKPTKTPKPTKTQKPGKNDHVILFNWWVIKDRNSSNSISY